MMKEKKFTSIIYYSQKSNYAAYTGFCATGAEGINITFVLLLSAVRSGGILISKQTNNQLFILYSADGFRADGTLNIPPA